MSFEVSQYRNVAWRHVHDDTRGYVLETNALNSAHLTNVTPM